MIKRYDFEEGHRGYPCAVECEDGGYVDYDDHAAELATLRAENERLREALRFYAGHWDQSTVSDVEGWGDDDTNWFTEYAVSVSEAKIIYSLINKEALK